MRVQILNSPEALQSIEEITKGYDDKISYKAAICSEGSVETALNGAANGGYLEAEGESLDILSMFGENRVSLRVNLSDFTQEISYLDDAEKLLQNDGYQPLTHISASASAEKPADALERLALKDLTPVMTLEGHQDIDTEISYNDEREAFNINVSETPYSTSEEADQLETDIRKTLASFNL
ncbi:hypothetical protein [Candidatus Nanohalococcus occultus]|uniref:hypothetical protein n=1 Tax=Candidatus Nanohalococcus occultus TaxID=2978047 RepID=UPI0039E12109